MRCRYFLLVGLLGCAQVESPPPEIIDSPPSGIKVPENLAGDRSWWEEKRNFSEADLIDILWIADQIGMTEVDKVETSTEGHPIDFAVMRLRHDSTPDDSMKFIRTTLTVYHRDLTPPFARPGKDLILKNDWFSDSSNLYRDTFHRFTVEGTQYNLLKDETVDYEKSKEILTAFHRGWVHYIEGCDDLESSGFPGPSPGKTEYLLAITDADKYLENHSDSRLNRHCEINDKSPLKSIIEDLLSEKGYFVYFSGYTWGEHYRVKNIDGKWYALRVDSWIS